MARIVVYHSSYGCETGCCGHVVELYDSAGKLQNSKFEFSHPHYNGEDHLEFAKRMIEDTFGKEHIKDLDWENCIIDED